MKLSEIKKAIAERGLRVATRDAILEADDIQHEMVSTPEWPFDVVIIRTMSGKDRDAWEQSLIGEKGKVNTENVRARLVAYTAVDEHGNRLLTDQDIERLGGKTSPALERCCKVAQRLNLLTEKELEDVKGN